MKAKHLSRISSLIISLILFTYGCEIKHLEPVIPDSSADMAKTASVQQTLSLTFFQLNVYFDDDLHPLSQWGLVNLEFVGTEELLYFNLVVNEVWRIRNMPVLSEAPDILQTISFSFDLGIEPGTEVTSLAYAYTLSTSMLDQQPDRIAQAKVIQEDYKIDTGFNGELIRFSEPPAVLEGGEAIENGTKHKDFPNQQAGNFECVPAAASNSLQWLNNTHNLNIPAADISIATLKSVVGWTEKGVPLNVDWPALKNQYLKNKGEVWKATITTEVIKAPQNPADAATMDKVLQKLKEGCDVEMEVPGHALAITGMQKIKNGLYSMDLTHDAIQGPNNKGTITEEVTYNTKTRKFTGGVSSHGKTPRRIIAECLKKHDQGGGN